MAKSLAKINPAHFTPVVLESQVTAVEQRVGSLLEFELPLRLFLRDHVSRLTHSMARKLKSQELILRELAIL